MSLHLTGKGSILDAIGSGISGVGHDIGSFFSGGSTAPAGNPAPPPPPADIAAPRALPSNAPGALGPPPAPLGLPANLMPPPPPTPAPAPAQQPSAPQLPTYHNPRVAAVAQALREGKISANQYAAFVNSLGPQNQAEDNLPNTPALDFLHGVGEAGVNTAKLLPDSVATLTSRSDQSAEATKNAFDNSFLGGLAPVIEPTIASYFQPDEMSKASEAGDYANRVLTKAYTTNPTTGEVNPAGNPVDINKQPGYTLGGANQASLEAGQAKSGLLNDAIINSGLKLSDTTRNNIVKAGGRELAFAEQAALLGLGGDLGVGKTLLEAGIKAGMTPEEALALATSVPKIGKVENALSGATLLGTSAGVTDLVNGQTNPGQVGLDITKNALPGLIIPAALEGLGVGVDALTHPAPLDEAGSIPIKDGQPNLNENAFTPEDIAHLEQLNQLDKLPPKGLTAGQFDAATHTPSSADEAAIAAEQRLNLNHNLKDDNTDAYYNKGGLNIGPFEGPGRPSPEELAIRTAQGVKGRPGSFDQAVVAYYNASPGIDMETARAETTKALENAGVTPVGGTKGEYAKGESPLGVKPLEVNPEEDIPHPNQKQKGLVKVTSLQNRMEDNGPAGRELAQRATNVRVQSDVLETKINDGLQSFYDLPKGKQGEAWLVKEGKATTADPAVERAVSDLKKTLPLVQQEGLQAGLKVGDRGETYMPHRFDRGYFDKPENFDKAVKELVKSGQASNSTAAIKLLNSYKEGDYMGGKTFSNLELQREVDLPGYRTDAKALREYVQGSARRIAEAHQFGVNNEVVNDLIDRANKNGDDAKALQDAFNSYWNPERGSGGALDKTADAALKTTRLLQLQKAAISHLPQGFANIGSEVGFGRYFKGVYDKIFNPDDQQFLHEAGFDAERNRDTSGVTGTAPGLKAVREFHRGVAGIVGRDYATSLADKGDEAGLRKFGVTGGLEQNPDGSFKLSDNQQVQAAHHLSDKTIFSTDRIQSPAWTQSNLGKFVGQYRTAYTFKQAGFINDLFREAKAGNIAPALRYLGVALPVSGAVVTVGKDLYRGQNPVTQTKKDPLGTLGDVLANSGGLSLGAGLADSAYNAARYGYDNDARWQNAAGTVAPLAGTAVQTGQNIDKALRGDPKALVKQGLGLIPGGSYLAGKRYPAKAETPEQQQYLNAYQKGISNLNSQINPPFDKSADPNSIKQFAQLRSDVQDYLAKNHTADGTTILNDGPTSEKNAKIMAANDQARSVVTQFEKSLPNHDPKWDLPDGRLKTYFQYEALTPGEKARTVMEQNNPWLVDAFTAEQKWYSGLQGLPSTVESPNYVPYPQLSQNQQDMLKQVTDLSKLANRTPDQTAQLSDLENNPDLQSAFGLLNGYTNKRRAQDGLQPINQADQLSPDEENALKYEASLPSGTGAKTAWIKANQDMWNGIQAKLANITMNAIASNGAIVYEGGTANPSYLKDLYQAGKYDIAPPVTPGGAYTLDPAAAYAASQKSGQNGGLASAYGRLKSNNQARQAKSAVKYAGKRPYIRIKSAGAARRRLGIHKRPSPVQFASGKPSTGKLRVRSTPIA